MTASSSAVSVCCVPAAIDDNNNNNNSNNSNSSNINHNLYAQLMTTITTTITTATAATSTTCMLSGAASTREDSRATCNLPIQCSHPCIEQAQTLASGVSCTPPVANSHCASHCIDTRSICMLGDTFRIDLTDTTYACSGVPFAKGLTNEGSYADSQGGEDRKQGDVDRLHGAHLDKEQCKEFDCHPCTVTTILNTG